MARYRSAQESEQLRKRMVFAAAQMFLTRGYSATTIREIAEAAQVSTSTAQYICKNKDEILAELVGYVLESQFQHTARMLEGVTDDKVLFYAAETALQLYIAESSENLRELYSLAYSTPKTAGIIRSTITGKLEVIFRDALPELEAKDFFELEIASGGIMHSFMMVPCDLYFTIEHKVQRFIETTFLIYRIPEEKTREAVEFVGRFDYNAIVGQVIDSMLEALEKELE